MSACWHDRPWSFKGGVWCIDCLTDRDEKTRQAERRAIRDALNERDPADSIWSFLGEFEKGGRFEVEEDE